MFPSIPVARRRLRKLVSAKYIAGYMQAFHDETRYMIDRLAINLLSEIDEKTIRVKNPPRKLIEPGEHHLGLVRFWTKLVLECHKSSDISIERFKFEWELAPNHLNTIIRTRPDASFKLIKNDQLHKFSVEFDRGTESPSYVMTTKFEPFARKMAGRRRYAEPHHMILLVEDRKRLRALARALSPLQGPILGRIFLRDNEGDPLLENTWSWLGNLSADLVAIPP